MGHNPVSLEPTRCHAANRRACVCKPLLVSRRKSVVMAGGTSRPRAIGDVTSVDTGSTSGSIPFKRNRGGILARIGTVCPFRGDGTCNVFTQWGGMKFVDYCADEAAPTSDIAPASS